MIETGTRIRNTSATESGLNGWFTKATTECKMCTISKDNCQEVDAPDNGY